VKTVKNGTAIIATPKRTAQKGEPMINRETYCKDCDRSIYGKYHDCDINIENDGLYVMADDKCYCKIVNGERAEKYPWERRTDD
jgi:hypothetical protein